MTTYTKNEQTVFNLIANESGEGGAIGFVDIEKATGINIKSLRGIVTSLEKKGRVDVDNEPVNGLRSTVFERAGEAGQQFRRADIGVLIKALADFQPEVP